MEDFQTEQTSGNTAEVAETQTETQETSVNNSEVANPEPVQNVDKNAHYADLRRREEAEQYRQKAETYQQQLDRAAKLAGYQSHDELVAALDEIEKAQQRQQYEEAGINPDLFNQLLSNHPDIQYAREMRAKEQEQHQQQAEVSELLEAFPNLQDKDITDEVVQLKQQKGLSLLDAYLRVNYRNLAQQKEQEALQKLQTNATSTPGSLGAGAEHKTGYSNLSDADKKALRERVLRGEQIEL